MPRKAIAIVSLALSFGICSCGLFTPRTADPPKEISSKNVPATDASLVFQNMIYAFQEGNDFYYSQTISDSSFIFTASGRASQRYGELVDWNKTKEHGYFKNVISSLPKNSNVTLEFTTVASTNYSDSCDLVQMYTLNVPGSVGGGLAKVYKGQAQFSLGRDPLNGNWYIHRWVDYELNSSDSTWSDLKGAFVN
jgi:hypothetical protein